MITVTFQLNQPMYATTEEMIYHGISMGFGEYTSLAWNSITVTDHCNEMEKLMTADPKQIIPND